MQCPGHDSIIGRITHSECPRQCIEDGYPPLPGDPDWPDQDAPDDPDAPGEPADDVPSQTPPE